MDSSLTAREAQEALEDRISRGIYQRGERLPSVRSIAAEIGTSHSTVSRAIQSMVRSGWLEIHKRQFVRVLKSSPSKSNGAGDAERAIKALAHKWKLGGGQKDELIALFESQVHQTYQAEVRFIFVECNSDDLNFMAQQIAEDLPDIPLMRSLIRDLDPARLRHERSAILVPYYHFSEVKQIVGSAVPIIPVHSSPNVETLDALVSVEPGTRTLVIGHNERSIARLSTLVTDYANVRTTGVAIGDRERLKTLAAKSDLIVAVKAAEAAVRDLPRPPRTIFIRFGIEGSLRRKVLTARYTEVPRDGLAVANAKPLPRPPSRRSAETQRESNQDAAGAEKTACDRKLSDHRL